MTPTAELPLDGRRARRERGRLAVIDAMVDLVREGHAPPTTEQVAERAGVSVSSLFRYFDNLEDLQRQSTERFFERYAPLFAVPGIGQGPLDSRVARFVVARTELFETVGPVARLTRARSFDHPHFAASLSRMRATLAEQVAHHFAPELDALPPAGRTDLIALITTLTSFESWDQLANELARTPRQIRRAWIGGLTTLIGATPT